MPQTSNASETTQGKGGLGVLLKSPLFLIGAGGVVLFVLARGGGSGQNGGGGATASSVQQALSEQQQSLADAIAASQSDNAAALAANRDKLEATLDLERGLTDTKLGVLETKVNAKLAEAGQTPTGQQTGLDAILAAIQKLGGSVTPGAAVDPGAALTTGGEAITKTGGKPDPAAIWAWAQGLRPDNTQLAFDWGKQIVTFFGRLPKDEPEFHNWMKQLHLE